MGTAIDVRRTGRIFGWFFIATFITSIPARLLFVDGLGASWNDMRFIPGAGSDTSLKIGAMLSSLSSAPTSRQASSSIRS